ncbi:MAG: GW dipeptide domain-containing protein [Cyclobacteriaceae bacterium]|nr:GW dipeptide domain-containing protein [Cyclobacteriaceae bacterium]
MKYFSFFTCMILATVLLANCNREVKSVSSQGSNTQAVNEWDTNHERPPVSGHSIENNNPHQVEVLEVLPTSNYSYLKVKENDNVFWIATVKGNYLVGEEYIYHDGLLMTDFVSAELNRTFDQVYLISKITPVNRSSPDTAMEKTKNNTPTKKAKVEGTVSLAAIINDPDTYKDQKVRVYGEVVKVNLGIMNRNWIHIKDGTADDYDFTITSQSGASVGQTIVFEGTITLDKDFGAGYTYKLIMEEAKPVN